MRVKTRLITGEAEQWDPGRPGAFMRLAGERVIDRQGDIVLVRDGSGHVIAVYRGWLGIRPDEDPGALSLASDIRFGLKNGLWGPE